MEYSGIMYLIRDTRNAAVAPAYLIKQNVLKMEMELLKTLLGTVIKPSSSGLSLS